MNIAVTDPDYKHALGIIRSLGRHGYKPYLIGFKTASLCSYSRYANKEIVLTNGYVKNELIEKLLIHGVELIILVGTDSFKKIVPWKDDLKINGINIITVDDTVQNIAFSKKETYNLAKKIGVPIPNTIYPKTFNEINSYSKNISYPCVIKGLFEVGGNIVDYAYNSNELESKYISICNKYNITEKDGLPMLQEYISGHGCAFFALYNNGKCTLTFQHKRIREYPVTGGSSTCAESYKNDKIEEYGMKLLDSLNWHGIAMVEFKLNTIGEPILMEINPKFWGSTDLALEAGVDFPKALIDIHNGSEVAFSRKYKYPFRYSWPLQGDILHAIEKPKAITQLCMDLLNPRVGSNLWLSDIYPTAKMLLDFIKIILVKIIRR